MWDLFKPKSNYRLIETYRVDTGEILDYYIEQYTHRKHGGKDWYNIGIEIAKDITREDAIKILRELQESETKRRNTRKRIIYGV